MGCLESGMLGRRVSSQLWVLCFSDCADGGTDRAADSLTERSGLTHTDAIEWGGIGNEFARHDRMDLILRGYQVNDPTWLYLSFLLILAVYFKFSRL